MINKRCFPLCLSLFLLLLSSVAFADNGFSGSMGEGDSEGQSSSANVITPGQGERIVSRPQTAEGVVPQAVSNYDDDLSKVFFMKLELGPAYYMALGSSTFCPARVIDGKKCEITSNKAFGYVGSFAFGAFTSKWSALFVEFRTGGYFPKYKSKASARFSKPFVGVGLASRLYTFNMEGGSYPNWMKGLFVEAGAGLFFIDPFTVLTNDGSRQSVKIEKFSELFIYGVAGGGFDFALVPTFRISVSVKGGYILNRSILFGNLTADAIYSF